MKNLRHYYLLVLFLFVAGLGPVRAQSFAWARLVRGAVDTSFVAPQASATDAAGNTYVAVSFVDSVRVGTIRLTGPHLWAQALVKYDATGQAVWGKVLVNIRVAKLAADNSAGGVFLTAFCRGAASWDGAAVPLGSNTDFYAKCAATGALQWTNSLPTPYAFGSTQVVADNAGSAYVAETVQSSALVGGTTVPANHGFLLKTNGAGASQWVQVLHNTANTPLALALGPKPGGGCLVGSTITNTTLYLGLGTGTPLLTSRPALTDGWLASFDAAGTPEWSQLIGNGGTAAQGNTSPGALAADASGNSYVTGTSTGTVQLGGGPLSTGFFLAKYSAAGVLQWVRGAVQSIRSAGYSLVAGSSGPTVVVSVPISPVPSLTVGTLVLRSPYNFVHFNDQGVAQWAVADNYSGVASTPYFQATGLGIDGLDNLYPVGQPSSLYNVFSVIQLGAHTTVGKGTVVSRINAYANTLRGQVYHDLNANGQPDAGEGVFPALLTGVLTQGSATIYAPVGADGLLQAYALPGAYTLGLAALPRYHTLTQPSSGSYAGSFGGSNQLVSGQDFGVAPIPNQADVRVSLTPYGAARPGFTTLYRVTVENVGTATVSGTATLTLDSRAAYISSTPAGSRAGQAITWAYSGLAPYTLLNYDVLFSLPTNTATGTTLLSTATAPLASDLQPADNTAALTHPVVNSYDPNAIEVNYERLTPAQVAARQPLDYTIHFQNLGTASAVNVLLSDTLDFSKLNPATLMLIAQSHNCVWSLSSTGPNTGLLTVRLLNINLPERNVDVIRSMGFVRFRVQPRASLTVGEVIPNHASIVFDYNSPVRTNTATTTVLLASAALAHHEAPAWEAYPNPATDWLTVAAELLTAGPVRLELLDVLGRPVRQQTLAAPAGPLRQVLDLRGLAAGSYVLRLTPPTGPATSRLIVRD